MAKIYSYDDAGTYCAEFYETAAELKIGELVNVENRKVVAAVGTPNYIVIGNVSDAGIVPVAHISDDMILLSKDAIEGFKNLGAYDDTLYKYRK